MAVRNCSPDTWCPGGTSDECPKGQSCHAGITECNMVDLMAKEKDDGDDPNAITQTRPSLSSDDPRNSKFVSLLYCLIELCIHLLESCLTTRSSDTVW